VYAGNCDSRQRDQLLGKAVALLHLISFDEPFGLSVVEAMCCGTPVIAFNRGSMPELIMNGRTGFLVENIEEAEKACGQLHHIRRKDCRERVSAKFSKERMAAEYYNVYQKIIAAQ
jgi:glycosyltransferase involved in cell wall biosynthesis